MPTTFTIENREFELVVASCVGTYVGSTYRDGMGWELWENVGGKWQLLIELFRNDASRKIDFAAFGTVDVPFAAVQVLLAHFTQSSGGEFHNYTTK